jgi:hypothetical protein
MRMHKLIGLIALASGSLALSAQAAPQATTGAGGPKSTIAAAKSAPVAIADSKTDAQPRAIDWSTARQFWAFQLPVKHPKPAVRDSHWPRKEMDFFVLAEMEKRGLKPVAQADKGTLLRRATFDLIGLPPTPDELAAFLKDESPDAFAKVVDRLLASPHYGERWGRHWLDVARYGEDQAHSFQAKTYSNGYHYRDWVVASLNEDMGYDRFVKLQIAADQLLTDETERLKHLPALGFMGVGAQYYKDNGKAAADELDDRVDTLSRGLLGFTVSCARCHDHKFDPIPTQDYYSLAGVFANCKLEEVPLADHAVVQRYQDGQQHVKDADDKIKAFVAGEKNAVNESQADEIAKYLEAVRGYRDRHADNGRWSVNEQAKQDNLRANTLNRWVKYFDGTPKVAALASWKQMMSARAKEQEVTQAAGDFQKQVKEMLAHRAKLNKEKSALLTELFGDKGPFAISDDELKKTLPAEKKQQFETLQSCMQEAKKAAPAAPPGTPAIVDTGSADMKVLLHGNPDLQGEVAPRRFLRVLAGDKAPLFSKGSGRLELAAAIASPTNPLTARVFVNRVWQWHFGRGIVGTPSNFGMLGDRPTHPELLDTLTSRFIESGWSLKALHREIMLSATYQLSSADDEKNLDVDADNRYLWRMSRQRLDIESWRDALLAVAGKLDFALGGPSVDLNATDNHRRTLYGKISRLELNGLLRQFDFPEANLTCEKRTQTTVPQQQLFVLNSAFFVDQARALAARVQDDSKDDAGRVRRAYLLALARAASDEEVTAALKYLSAADVDAEKSQNQLTRWERFAQALLGCNEFIYVD